MKEEDSEDFEMTQDPQGEEESTEKAGHSAYKVPKDQKLRLLT